MRKLLQINPVVRVSTSTGRIMQEIGEMAMRNGWESYIAYGKGRDGLKECKSRIVPIGGRWSTLLHGVETRLLDRHGLASSRATREFVRQIERIEPDIVHIHNIHGYFLNYRILFDYLSQSNIPVVWTVHDCWLYTGHCYYYSYIQCDKWEYGCGHCPQRKKFPASYLLDRSRRNFRDKKAAFTSMPRGKMVIVPVSEWIRNEMRRSFLSGYGYRVIHNGIDIDTFRPCGNDKIKEQYGITGKHVLLGVASIWSKEKGLDDFLRLSERLNNDEIIILVGVKTEEKKRLPGNIVGISRTENIHQLAALYSAADVFVNPTWQDNYPTVNLESIACGTPVVTYRTGGSVEAINDETGFVVEQGDIDGLLQAAREIIKRGASYYTYRCRKFAEANFNKEDRYRDYLDLYDELSSK